MDEARITWLSADEPQRVWAWLGEHTEWAREATFVRVEVAGQGNMNVVLRVRTRVGTMILKQSRPFVAKYPSIPAPLDRTDFEGRFYKIVARNQHLAKRMPRCFGIVADDHVLLCEDLAPGRDASYLYSLPAALDEFAPHLEALVDWLADLHAWSKTLDRCEHFTNETLRQLNAEHLARIPFQEPPALDLDGLTPGLAAVSQHVRTDRQLVGRCAELGALYLAPGECLLHGDFFPGSWYVGRRGVVVIDPEFCYFGRPEFDLGVMLGHLVLITGEPSAHVERLLARYCQRGLAIDRPMARQFAALEVLRRLLGVAQLPSTATLAEKRQAIDWAVAQLTH